MALLVSRGRRLLSRGRRLLSRAAVLVGNYRITIDGAESRLLQREVLVRFQLGGTSSAMLRLRGRLSDMPPRTGRPHVVVVRRLDDNAVVFSGTSRGLKRRPTGPDFGDLDMPCVGHDTNLLEVIPNDTGIAVAGQDSGSAQLREVVTVADVSLAHDRKVEIDVRLGTVRRLVEALAMRNDAVIWPIPTADGVSFGFRGNDRLPVFPGLTLTAAMMHRPRYSSDPKDTVRNQYLLGALYSRTRTFDADGAAVEYDLRDVFLELDFFAPGAAANAFGDTEQDRGLRFTGETEADVDAAGVVFFGPENAPPSDGYLGTVVLTPGTWYLVLDRPRSTLRLLPLLLPVPASSVGTALLLRHTESGDEWSFQSPVVGTGGQPIRSDRTDITLSAVNYNAPFNWRDNLYLTERVAPSSFGNRFSAYDEDGHRAAAADRTGVGNKTGAGSVELGAVAVGDYAYVLGSRHAGSTLFNTLRRYNMATSTDDDTWWADLVVAASEQRSGNPRAIRVVRDLCTDGTTIWALGYIRHDDNTEEWALWAFTTERIAYSNISANSLTTAVGKKIALVSPADSTERWTGCYYSGGTVFLARAGGTVQAFNAASKGRQPGQDIDATGIATANWGQMAGIGTSIWWFNNFGRGTDNGYSWQSRDRGLLWAVSEQQQDAIVARAGQDPTFRVVLVDSDIRGVDVGLRRYVPGPPGSAETVTQVAIDGEATAAGVDGSALVFDRARQALLTATALATGSRLRVTYGLRPINVATGGTGTRDAVERLDVDDPAEAQVIAEALLERKRQPVERIECGVWRQSADPEIRVGHRLNIAAAALRSLGVLDVTGDEAWVIEEIAMRTRGGRSYFRVVLDRIRYVSRYLDFMRAWREGRV